MSRRIKAMGPPTERSKSFLRDYAEHGFGMSMTQFNKKHGYGSVCHKRWSSDIDGFREKFEELQRGHKNRTKVLGPEPRVLPASHTENLTVWQQNFLESWRRGKKRLGAAAKAKVSWAEVEHSLTVDEDFRKAYEQTEKELIIGIRDELMANAYEGKINAITKLLASPEATQNNQDDLEKDWWMDMDGVAESLQ